MAEFESFAARRRNNLTHVSIHDIPGDTEKEQLQWKIEQKKEYSRPRRRWSKEDLAKRFPDGKWHPKVVFDENGGLTTIYHFVAENNVMSREFNNNGYEISRRHFRREPGAKPSALDVHSVDFSQYDVEGYLIRYTFLQEHKVGYVAKFFYENLPDGTKALVTSVEQDILRTGIMEPGKRIGPTFTIDFTNIPLVR